MSGESPKRGHLRQQLAAQREAADTRDDAITMPDGRMRNPDYDPLARQRPGDIETWLLEPATGTKLYETVWFLRHVAEILSEDPIRNWFDLEFLDLEGNVVVDDIRARDFQQYCEELNAIDITQTALIHEAIYGDGLVVAGIKARGRGVKVANPSSPILPEQVGEILYLVAKARDDKFTEIVVDENLANETYGLPTGYKIAKSVPGSSGGSLSDTVIVDATRALHFQTRPRVSSRWGLPVHVPLWSVIQLITNLEWSAGQVAFNMATRVIKSDEMVGDLEQRVDFAAGYESEVNTLSSVILGKDESMSTASSNPGDLSWLSQLTWDIAAAATRVNKTRLLGTQAGALASADTDMKRYYEWIGSRQELWLRRPLRHLSALILSTESMSTAQSAGGAPIVSFRPRTSDRVKSKTKTGDAFRLVFRPVEGPTEKEAANLKVREAQAVNARLEGFKNLAMGLQTLADLGMTDPGRILEAIFGEELTEDSMKELMESTRGLEAPELGARAPVVGEKPTTEGKKPAQPEGEES